MVNGLFSAARKPQSDVNWCLYARWAVFAVIMVAAAYMRLWRLDEVPSAMFRDEAEKALNGWFLLNGGVDAAGRPWPIFIKVFGVTTSAIYQYATIPFLAVGGLNEWTARLPAACVGIATVALTWALVRRLWGWQAAAWAAGLLAVSSWHVPLSRWAQQGIFLPFFFTAAALALVQIKALRNVSSPMNDDTIPEDTQSLPATDYTDATWLAIAGACIGLAMYTYDPARLFAPLLALAAAVIWWRVWIKRWRAVLIGMAAFLICVSPVIWLMLNQGDAAMARFKFLSIAQPGLSASEIAWQFLRNYASHFSMTFLLTEGDAELRHGIGRGVLGTVDFIWGASAIFALFQKRDRWLIFFIVWVLLAPVPASLTREGVPHALRSQMALPAWQCLAAFGLMNFLEITANSKDKSIALWRLNRIMWPVLTLLWAFSLFQNYFEKYPQESAANWQFGVKQALQYLNQPTTRNSQVVFKYVTGAEYLVPFYLKMDRPEYRRMLAGQTRYQFADPRTPMENWLTNPPDAPRAVVTLMGVPRIEGSANMFIDAPGGHGGSRAVMQIFRTPELMEQIEAGVPVEPPLGKS